MGGALPHSAFVISSLDRLQEGVTGVSCSWGDFCPNLVELLRGGLTGEVAPHPDLGLPSRTGPDSRLQGLQRQLRRGAPWAPSTAHSRPGCCILRHAPGEGLSAAREESAPALGGPVCSALRPHSRPFPVSGPSAEERGVCPRVRRERHPQEERGCELAAHGVPRGRSGLQSAGSGDHEGGDEEHGAGNQGPGQGPEHHGPAEGLRGHGQVRAAGAGPGCAHLGDGGLRELGHHAEHAPRAGGQPHRADRRGERPGGPGPAQPAARGRLGRGRELWAQPGGPAVPQVGCLEELAVPPPSAPLPWCAAPPLPWPSAPHGVATASGLLLVGWPRHCPRSLRWGCGPVSWCQICTNC